MDALRTVNYSHTVSIRFWKTGCEDEGVRSICQYMKGSGSNVKIIELLDNEITQLGCEFLSKILVPELKLNLQVLKLDHNNFGSGGVEFLAEGLCQNKVLTSLSLTYCSIDAEGAKSLFKILIFQSSALEEMNLGGNHLRNEGTIEVLRGVSAAKSLKKIFLSDNQF
jgi:Ran GTPase-activating protein (RanGAP) involved in mRNA processing and transport